MTHLIKYIDGIKALVARIDFDSQIEALVYFGTIRSLSDEIFRVNEMNKDHLFYSNIKGKLRQAIEHLGSAVFVEADSRESREKCLTSASYDIDKVKGFLLHEPDNNDQ